MSPGDNEVLAADPLNKTSNSNLEGADSHQSLVPLSTARDSTTTGDPPGINAVSAATGLPVEPQQAVALTAASGADSSTS